MPEDVDGAKLPKLLRDGYGITANGGQNQLSGKIRQPLHPAIRVPLLDDDVAALNVA